MLALSYKVVMPMLAILCGTVCVWALPFDEEDLDARIDKVRKADFTVRFTGSDGKPLTAAEVIYTLTRHDFLFGTCLSTDPFRWPEDNPDRVRYLDTVARYFNYAVHENALKWSAMEPERGQYDDETPMKMWEWCRDHDIEMRGHCVYWGRDSIVQAWIKGLDKVELERAMKARAERVLKLFDGKIMEFDLNNEMMHVDYFGRVLGFKNGVPYFEWCKSIAPHATFYVNEYAILSGKDTFGYVHHIRELIENGAQVGGIGLQSHFMRGRVPDNVTLWAKLQTLSQFNLPIKITEFDISTNDDDQQARDLRRFYRVCLAHPSVRAILMWGFWEGKHWIPPACLWRKDWTPRPAAEAYVRLVTEELSTRGKAMTNEHGELKFRGFFGTYRLDINGRSYTAELTRESPEAVAK